MKGIVALFLIAVAAVQSWERGYWESGSFVTMAAVFWFGTEGALEIFKAKGRFHGTENVYGGMVGGIWLIAMALIGGLGGKLTGISISITVFLIVAFFVISFWEAKKKTKREK